jgi:hypothetical protein
MPPRSFARGISAVGSSLASTEPDLLHALQSDLQMVGDRMHHLEGMVAREAFRFPRSRAWQRLHQETAAARSRVEAMVRSAATRDGLQLQPQHPSARIRWAGGSSVIGRCRKLARDVEEQCAAAAGLASSLGFEQVAQALQACRCELIGLEQPLIAIQAEEAHQAAV